MASSLRKMGKKQGGGSKSALEIKNRKHFEDAVLNAEVPVIVDFWAPWCGPCKQMAPIFEQAAKAYEGRVLFAKVNTEAVPAVSKAFNITSIPSLLVFSEGEVIDARVGVTPPASLEALAQRAIDKHAGVTLMQKVKRWFGGKAEAQAEAEA